ncbi:MAG: cytochrome P450 [Paracoccaceae bacterium]
MQSISPIQQLPTAPEFLANPYAFYDRARALGDFVFWEDYQMVMATSYEAVNAVLSHSALGREPPMKARSTRPAHLFTYHSIDDHSLLQLEAPEHTRLRKTAVAALSDEIILSMTLTISQICDDLISAFPNDAAFDLQSAYADKVPGITLMRLLGFGDDMHMQFQEWARDVDGLFLAKRDRSLEDAAEQASVAFNGFMTLHLAKVRNRSSSDDFITRVLKSQKTLDDAEIIALVMLIVQAGTGTAAYAIGHALEILADHPERALALAPDQIAATVSECLRYEPPLHVIARHAQDDVALLGHLFPRDTQIGCLTASACHDDAVWPDGNKFDPFRAVRPHLGFGKGAHACIGNALTHLIMKIALPALFSRCPELRIVSKPRIANEYMFRRFERLDVCI